MTENKRFHFGYVLGDTGLIDEQSTEHKWFIENCCSVSDLKKNWKTVCDKLNEVAEENEQLKQQLNKIFVLIDIKQNISKENMEEWAFKDVPASTSREYYYSGMLDACMQLRDEILNGDVE